MTCWRIKTVRDSHVEMGLYFNEFHDGVTFDRIKEECHLGDNR